MSLFSYMVAAILKDVEMTLLKYLNKKVGSFPETMHMVTNNGKLFNMILNMVVSNHFHSVKNLLFSSARSCDFNEMFSIELPVSMYTTKTPIDLCHFNIRSST